MVSHVKVKLRSGFLCKPSDKEVPDFFFEDLYLINLSPIDLQLVNFLPLPSDHGGCMKELCVVIFHIEPVCSSTLPPDSFSSNDPLVKDTVCCIKSGHFHIVKLCPFTLSFKVMYHPFQICNFVFHVIKVFSTPCSERMFEALQFCVKWDIRTIAPFIDDVVLELWVKKPCIIASEGFRAPVVACFQQ